MTFMDIELPDGNGQDLTEEIYKKDPSAYVVIVSGNISAESVARCEKIGAKGFVAKPINRDKKRLLSMVDSYNKQKQKVI